MMVEDSAATSLRISYGPAKHPVTGSSETITVSFGIVINASATIHKSVSVTPIVSKGTESAFPVETGNTLTYSFSFVRIQPEDYDDTSTDDQRWSNNKWYIRSLMPLIDRWQLKTDGCIVDYNWVEKETPLDSDNPQKNILPINPNTIMVVGKQCYIRNITTKYSIETNVAIYGSIELVLGRMHISSATAKLGWASPTYLQLIQDSGTLASKAMENLTTDTNQTIGKNFGVNGALPKEYYAVAYTIDTSNNQKTVKFKLPYPPTSWGTYARISNTIFESWTVSVKEGNTDIITPYTSYPNNDCSINIGNRDMSLCTFTVTAVWRI